MRKLSFFLTLFLVLGCTTKGDIRREEEFERLRQDVSHAKANKVDFEVVQEETKNELSRLTSAVGEITELHRKDTEEHRKELQALALRIQTLEQKGAQEEAARKEPPSPPELPRNFEAAKKLLDEGKYEDAAEIFQSLSKGNSAEAKKSQFFLAEAHFAKKDYASAALEYNEFRKKAPKDPLVPNAIFRQSLSFKGMGKLSDARLFFQDLIDRYPKSPFAQKAKAELKRLK